MSNVNFEREDYRQALADWNKVDVVCEGQRAIKEAKETYLPDPNMVSSGSTEKANVYASYLSRASFFNITGQTLQTLVGTAFAEWPSLAVPGGLEYVSDDIDGAGISIYQQSQSALGKVLKNGRCALWVDYPATDLPASRAEQAAGLIRANCLLIDAKDIINWRTSQIGGKQMLTLVVMRDSRTVADDFAQKEETIYRVLKLDAGAYIAETWVQTNDAKAWVIESAIAPRDGSGNLWGYIPFFFIGSQDNSPAINKAPLIDMADLNVKHYQVAADWYNALFYAGQPQPVISGLTEAWRDHLEKAGIVLGSRALLPLPVGGSFQFASVPADIALPAELDKLEKRMQAIGARLITPGEAVMTATQARDQNIAQHSILSLAAQNVSEAYTVALQAMGLFMRADGDVSYQLATSYTDKIINAQILTALIAANQAGKLPDDDLFRLMREMGLVDPEKTNEQIREELGRQGGGIDLAA